MTEFNDYIKKPIVKAYFHILILCLKYLVIGTLLSVIVSLITHYIGYGTVLSYIAFTLCSIAALGFGIVLPFRYGKNIHEKFLLLLLMPTNYFIAFMHISYLATGVVVVKQIADTIVLGLSSFNFF